jgi:exodeoxyribonuclease VII small subunit
MNGSNDDGTRELEGQLTLFAGQVVNSGESPVVEAAVVEAAVVEAAVVEAAVIDLVESDTKDDTKVHKAKTSPRSKKTELKGLKEMQPQETQSEIDFEASLTQLESVVRELDGEVKLEAALKLFESGIKLSVDCEKFIKSAEQKIEILKKQADGSMEAESFESETKRILAGD